jgi:electron transfer flavoprotein beta subunit
MEIIVCIKRVPDVSEIEVELDRERRSIVATDLDYDVNEWDNFAIEAAVRLKETRGARVTAMTVGDEDSEEVLRRALAMGADDAVHLMDPEFEGSDAWGIATILHHAIADRPHDLVLTGAISADQARGQVGGMLAAMLDIPMIALATDLSVEDGTATVRHEVEGGLERVEQVDLPALLTVQTGMKEPRYVSIRGIRKVARTEIPVLTAAELGLDPATIGAGAVRVSEEGLSLPTRGEGAEILSGNDDEVIAGLVERLHQQGGF